METTSLTWETYEYAYREKSSDWYWSVGIIAAALAVTSILFSNFLLAIVIIIGTFALLLVGSRRPNIVRFTLSEDGVAAGNMRYPFSAIHSFWVDKTTPDNPKILFRMKTGLASQLAIPLGEVRPEDVRTLLSKFIPAEEQTEPFAHRLMERLGF